jgi:hypothetical protein
MTASLKYSINVSTDLTVVAPEDRRQILAEACALAAQEIN